MKFIYVVGLPKKIVALLSGCAWSMPLSAQMVAPPAPSPPPPEIVVIGSPLSVPPGTPAYGSVIIGRERLINDASGRLENALRDVAGFQQFRRSDSRSANPSAQGVTLRALGGNASSRALLLLDGVPIADPFFGHVPFTAIVAERLSAVRVTRGGGAGPFGAGAVAGTIELTSADRRDLVPVGGSAFYGSDNAQELTVSTASDLGRGFADLSARFDRGDGFFTAPADQRSVASVRARYRDWSIGLRAVAPLDSVTDVQVRGLVFGDHRTLRFRGADSSTQGQDVSVRLVHRGHWAIDALGYLQARDFSNRVISATSFRLTLDQRATPSTGGGGKVELRPPVGGGHLVRFGADVRIADGNLSEDAYGVTTGLVTVRRRAGGRTATVGGFIEDDWTLGSLVVTGGVRIDRWTISDGRFTERSAGGVQTASRHFADRGGVEPTGRLGVLWRVSDSASLRSAGYTGFRVPTLNELYRPFVVFPVTTQANAGLGLERLRGVEGGADLTLAPGITLSMTGFVNRLNGAIANVTIGTNSRQRQNVDAIVARGVEVTAGAIRGNWSLSASYAFSDSRVSARGVAAALNGLRPAQSPRHALSTTLGWATARGPRLSATVRHVSSQFEDDLQVDSLRAATTLDAIIEMPLGKHVAIIGRGENLFDAAVETRNVAGSIDLGAPRRLWIGMRLR